jgi:hypothetical protein
MGTEFFRNSQELEMLKTGFLVTLSVTIKITTILAGFVVASGGSPLMADLIMPPRVRPEPLVNPGAEQKIKQVEQESAKQIEEEAMRQIEEIRSMKLSEEHRPNPEKSAEVSLPNPPSAENRSFSLVANPAIGFTIAAGSGLAIAIGSLVLLKRKSQSTI